MSVFGNKIMALRNDRNMDTKAVAQAVGIPQSRYSELERGVRVPADTQIERLEKFFGLGDGELAGLMDNNG
ncbi:MAG: XRE family transcriptional regulator [Desulfobacteraceae bacterium]|jgi:transcriptional regulator with XRE-family HTH domain|nr:MAG: XRE family transcriptional regulator [Desulfobacteraceae bacterium]